MENKKLLLSVKPEFALQIIQGQKTIELRRKFPIDRVIGGLVLIYASSPLKKLLDMLSLKMYHFFPSIIYGINTVNNPNYQKKFSIDTIIV